MTGRTARLPLWVPLTLFGMLFLAGRLWFFVDFPIGAVHPDSGLYFRASEAIQQGIAAKFGDRSPGLPLLMAAVFSVVNKLMALVYVQSALSALAGLAMIWAVYSLSPWLSLPVAVALGAYFMDCDALEHDSAVLSESLYTSLVMLSFAAYIKVFGSSRPAWFAAAASTGQALVLCTRPGGMWLLVIYALALGYFVWQSVPRRLVAAYALPFPILLLALATYNSRTIGQFVLSASDATEISLITNFYWETDPSYPPEINAAIVRVQALTAARNPPDDLRALAESWDFPRLYSIYARGHYYGPHLEVSKATSGWGEPDYRQWLLRISRDTITRYPDRYFKHFLVMMSVYYKSVAYNIDFRQYLYNRVNMYYIEDPTWKSGMPELVRWRKEFAEPGSLPPAITVLDFDKTHQMDLNQRILFKETFLTRIYQSLSEELGPLFATVRWSYAQLLVFAVTLGVWVRSRLRHDAAFLVLIVALAPLGNGMVASLVEITQPRYSAPLEWAYYVSLMMLPILMNGASLLPRRVRVGPKP